MTRFGSSYFRSNLSGLGADDQSLPLADQALLALVSATPSLVYTEWATEVSDSPAGSSWKEAQPTQNYQAYAVNDLQLVSVASTASSEVETLVVISPVLTQQQVLTTTFEGTPFSYDHTEAVYLQLDNKSSPQIYFLYWLRLRDQTDPKTGPTSLNYAAAQVAGVLAYVVPTPTSTSDRPRPASGSFPVAFNAQVGSGPLRIPSAAPTLPTSSPGLSPAATLPAQIPAPITPVTQASVVAATPSSNAKALLLVGLGAGAALLGYHLIAGQKKAS